MVGDSLTSDIQGGNNYGIATCWYNPNHDDAERVRRGTPTRSTPSIAFRTSSPENETRRSGKSVDLPLRRREIGYRVSGRSVGQRTTPVEGPVHEQHDHGADDRADDTANLHGTVFEVGAEQDVAEEAADEAADDAEQPGAGEAHRVRAGHEKAGQRSRQEADERATR